MHHHHYIKIRKTECPLWPQYNAKRADIFLAPSRVVQHPTAWVGGVSVAPPCGGATQEFVRNAAALSLIARVTHETTLANIIKFAVINDKVTSRRHLNYLFSAPFDPQGKGVYFI